VRGGTARVLIVETGRRTAFGTIAARLEAAEPETESILVTAPDP
jgi:Mg2+-importing ATPase